MPAMPPLGATPSEVVKAAFLLGNVCGSLEDVPDEMADIFAYQCLRTVVLRGRLTRGRHLRLCWSAASRERQAIEELGQLEQRLAAAPRLLHSWRTADCPTLIGCGQVDYDMTGVSDGRRRLARAPEVRGLYRELKSVLGGRAVVPLPD